MTSSWELVRAFELWLRRLPGELMPADRAMLRHLATRNLDPEHLDAIDFAISIMAFRRREIEPTLLEAALDLFDVYGSKNGVNNVIIHGLISAKTRDVVLGRYEPEHAHTMWLGLWSNVVLDTAFLSQFESEVNRHYNNTTTDPLDLAYMADIAWRIALGQIASPQSSAVRERASEILCRASHLYKSIGTHVPNPDGAPNVMHIFNDMFFTIGMPLTAVPPV